MSALLSYEPDLGSCRDAHLEIQNDAPALRGIRASAAVSDVAALAGAASAPQPAQRGEVVRLPCYRFVRVSRVARQRPAARALVS